MGWWKADDGVGVIGDGPADALSLALGDIFARSGTPLRLEDLLAEFLAALAMNAKALVADPASLEGKTIVARFQDGGEYRATSPAHDRASSTIDDMLYAAIEDAATHYRDAYGRKPSVAELLETFTFVLRGREEVAFPGSAELDALSLGSARPSGPTEPASIMVALPPGTTAADVAAAASVTADFTRDPDRAGASSTGGKRTSFASWSGREGDDREIDFHSDSGIAAAWLEVRGRNAGTLGETLGRELRGRIAPSADAALADLMTPPRGRPTSASGAMRWRSLQAALTAGEGGNALLRPLIAAGLNDPDWRVRMLAVLATGRLRLAELAKAAMAARVPDAGTSGLDREDRRSLLALRHAAHNLALGLETANGIVGAPDVLGKRVAYQERLRRLIDTPPATITDRASALVALLTGRPRAPGHALPGDWREWMDE
jgi:hypothetical protein